MISLTTQCPECHTQFSVAGDELRRRKGLVRCIQCHEIFDGYDAVVETTHTRRSNSPGAVAAPTSTVASVQPDASGAPKLPDVPADHGGQETSFKFPDYLDPRLPAASSETDFVVDTDDSSLDVATDDAPFISEKNEEIWQGPHPSNDPSPLAESVADPEFFIEENPLGGESQLESTLADSVTAAAAAATATTSTAIPALDSDAPVYAERRIEPAEFSWRASLKRLGLQLLLWLLVVLALLQSVYVYRAQIALHAPFMRPALQSLCAYVGCQVPYLRVISAIDITYSRLSLEDSGSAEQSYLLQVGLRNNASVPQEWPTLLITFSDVSATVLARLEVAPDQYLRSAQRSGPFLPGQTVDLRLQVKAQYTRINGFKVEKFFS